MIRLWPGSLAWRIVVVVLLGVLVVQGVGFVAFIADRRERAETLLRVGARQIVATTRLVETTPAAQRRLVMEAVSNPLFRVRASTDLAFLERHGWEPAPFWVASGVRARLADIGARDLRVHVRRPFTGDAPPDFRGHGPRRGEGWERGHGRFEPSRRRLAVSVPVDGFWLTFLVASDATSLSWALRATLLWALTLALVLVVAWWASRRVARPFQRFAAAADRFGTDIEAPPLPETGAGELRQAVRAFNRMQARIRRMVEDRTMMLGAVSHDLRTMLTRLRLRTELIDDDAQRAKAEADLDEMQAMLEGTLAFAKGSARAEPTGPVDLAALLQTIADEAEGENMVHYTGPDRLVVAGRATALKRLFTNLVSNAVRYGGGGEIRLEPGGERIEVLIDDHGPGIPEADLARVFEPFYRVEASRARATGGVGLGLAIARTLAREHGGDIGLTNRPEGGLRARVTLPTAPPPGD